jgi:hypothetical protein
MYCPKCGTENAESNKYCRACRENLGLISQAIKQRLPVMIASRLDQILDSRSERFRRDSVLGFAASGIFGINKNWWWITSFLLLSLLAQFWDYVSYQRLSAAGLSRNGSSAWPARRRDSGAESPSAPTTNELAPPSIVTESTTRRLDPLAAEKRGGDLL